MVMSLWRHDRMLEAGGTNSPRVLGAILCMVTFDPKRTFEISTKCQWLLAQEKFFVHILALRATYFAISRKTCAHAGTVVTCRYSTEIYFLSGLARLHVETDELRI